MIKIKLSLGAPTAVVVLSIASTSMKEAPEGLGKKRDTCCEA